jgi:hypothetical protein
LTKPITTKALECIVSKDIQKERLLARFLKEGIIVQVGSNYAHSTADGASQSCLTMDKTED